MASRFVDHQLTPEARKRQTKSKNTDRLDRHHLSLVGYDACGIVAAPSVRIPLHQIPVALSAL